MAHREPLPPHGIWHAPLASEERATSSQPGSGGGAGGVPRLDLNSGPGPSMTCPLGAMGSNRGGEPQLWTLAVTLENGSLEGLTES